MPTLVDLSTLGSDGFTIQGDAAGDQAGYSVSAAGDVNGDGFDDIIVGAPYNDASGFAGKAYVIFGKASGFGTIDLLNLQVGDGFVIQGEDEYDATGISVSGAGDINGDGFDDIIVSALAQYDFYYSGSATAHVIFGKQSPASVDLDSLSLSDGFAILGEYGQASRLSVSEAGDINGDGFADFIIGDAAANNLAGSAYVIFGKAGGFGSIDLANLALPVGFEIAGGAGDRAGVSVSGAGDVNGDGFDDLIVGANRGDNGGNNAGEAYVIFGKAGGFANIDLASLVPGAGFVIQGDTAEDWAGFSVSAAGDVNGDGFDDLILGAPLGDDGGYGAGEAYVIFGKASGFGTFDLTNLAAGAGFIIQGDAAGDAAGWSVSAAGDFNGDGFDDLIVGAPFGDDGGIYAGQAYVIFGKASGFGTIDLTNLDPAAGFVIQGDSSDDRAGQSVSGAGDVNGDGFADLVVGARGAGGDDAGKAYVIFGATTLGVTLTGTESGETLAGGSGNDFLDGRGGDDILVGDPGNDQLSGGSGNDILIGGAGADILDGGAGNDRIHFDAADTAAQITGGAGLDVLVVVNTAAPTNFNLTAQGFEFAELTQTDSGANPWSSIVQVFNASWALLQYFSTDDDGTRVQIDLDPANVLATSQVWSSFDAQGRLSTYDQFFDNGIRTFINADEASNQPFTQNWFNYDAQGRLDYQDVLWDDGTRTFVNFDQNNSQPWTQAWFTYDAQGRLDTQDVINDDGSHTFYNYDQAGTETFAVVALLYNTVGTLTQQVTAWDDGTTTYTFF